MRIVLAPAGSRGDFQPLLALALGLRAARHDVVMLVSPNFAAEVEAFGVAVHPYGFDVEAFQRQVGFVASPARATYELFKIGRAKVGELVREGIPLVRGADLLVGAGAQIAAPTIAEFLGIPYVFVAYTPQAFRSRHHPPFTVPFIGLPRLANRLLWRLFAAVAASVFSGPLGGERRRLRLPPVRDWDSHFFPPRSAILASDPELAPLAPDSRLARPPTGALHLPDDRPLAPELERFLAAGPPPVYCGFGSMPDRRPVTTTRLLVAAARAAGVRLVLSRGWAGYGPSGAPPSPSSGSTMDANANANANALGDDVFLAGPSPHALLFPRVAAVVHHGGAGTTAAAARAGRPQIVVPHFFDQFMFARWVHAAGLGPPPLRRARLSEAGLAAALGAALGDPRYRASAEEIGARLRERDSTQAAVEALEALAETYRASAVPSRG